MRRVNKEVVDYVEAEILPKYNKLGGHTALLALELALIMDKDE